MFKALQIIFQVRNTDYRGHWSGNDYEANSFLSFDHTNVLFGGDGNDILTGNIFNDVLIGGRG